MPLQLDAVLESLCTSAISKCHLLYGLIRLVVCCHLGKSPPVNTSDAAGLMLVLSL